MKFFNQNFVTLRKVKLILGLQRNGSCGTEWSQYCWVSPVISRRSPVCSTKIYLLLTAFMLDFSFGSNTNLRVSPNDRDAITGSTPNKYSSSEYFGIIDLLSLYKLTRQLLNLVSRKASNFLDSICNLSAQTTIRSESSGCLQTLVT